MTAALITVGIIAVAAVVSIWKERYDENRELERKRRRLYQGGLL